MDIRNLIDKVEEENKSRAQLEERIDFLDKERKRLRLVIREQKKEIEELNSNISEDQGTPEDLKILKDLVKSQREELKQKDDQVTVLKENIMELTSQLEDYNRQLSNKVEIREFETAQQRINQLLEEKENNQAQIETLRTKLSDLKENDQQEQLIVKLNTANEKIQQLEQQKKDLDDQVYYLQEQLEETNQNKDSQTSLADELSEAYATVETLKQENEDLKSKIVYLEEELDVMDEKYHKKINNIGLIDEFKGQFEKEKAVLVEKNQHYEQMISELEDTIENKDIIITQLQQKAGLNTSYSTEKSKKRAIENEETLNLLKQFSKQKQQEFETTKSKVICVENLPNQYQRLLIERMFDIMNKYNKERFVDTLIQDLYHEKAEIRRFAIKVLSKIKTTKVFNALIDLLYDKDWLVRFYLVKALGTFKEFEGTEEVMKAFLNDSDGDVRRAAREVLEHE
jgi:chromosome segregation ATPase